VRVLYFGTYERDYPRNAQVISCLRTAGVEVVESHAGLWDSHRHKLSFGIRTVARALRAEVALARRSADGCDAVIVGYPGHIDMPTARRVAGPRPLVFNPLVSLEDTMVGDRGLFSSASLRGRALRAVDRRAFRTADLVVADTAAHAAYYAARFDIRTDRVAVCFVGAEDRLFRPGTRAKGEFNALFVGKLIPLHGLETILAAASLCPDIPFHIVGTGQLDAMLVGAPKNVLHDPWIDYERLPALYRSAGCALGIFGTSEKAERVIPNKAFQALATATPLITSDTVAQRELLRDGRDALLVPAGDPEALASAVRRLAADGMLRAELGARGRETYVASASESALGAVWRTLLERLL